MRVNTNHWNKIRYTLYTPIYDLLGSLLDGMRKRSIALLDIKNNDQVLIVGAGTGLDIKYIDTQCTITATDLTPSMVSKIQKRNAKYKRNLKTLVMDAQDLTFPDETFDKVILHLIVAVVPNPTAALAEAERVLKKGGKIVVMDKFVHKGHRPSFFRKLANMVTTTLFSDITRSFEDILSPTQLIVVSDQKGDPTGNFRIILLEKPADIRS